MSIGQNEKPEIRISYDNMEVFLKLPIPSTGKTFTVEELLEQLEMKGVRSGIDRDMLCRMVEDKIYTIEKCVAVGRAPIDGTDGQYEFLFNRVFNSTPLQRPDGSVDYHSVNVIATVGKGDEVAIYHPCVQGISGENVKGAAIPAKRARELPPLKGTGFTRSPDGNSYYASLTGRIEYKNDRLNITPLYEINGDTDLKTGNIDFVGDVVIHGMVKFGMQVRATGSVTIDGIVEGANIEAGKDIVLKSGLMGRSQSTVRTKGNFFAKFVEFANLDVAGTINAEVLLNCNTVCGGQIIISGKQGTIVGGSCKAIGGILANNIGTEMEVKTEITVGAEGEIYRRMKVLTKKIETTEDSLRRIDEQLQRFAQLDVKQPVKEQAADPRKVTLLRAKIQQTTENQKDHLELARLQGILDLASGARIQIVRKIYGGVTVRIGDLIHYVKEEQFAVEFIKVADKISMIRLEEDVN